MYCAYCSHEDTKVLESRQIDDALRRRRECLECGNRFTTYERAFFQLQVTKKDGREQPFEIEKLESSIRKACSKQEPEEISVLAKKIEQKILLKKINPIKTKEIGKLVLQELRRCDKIAYLRYATVHKGIDDPKILKKELQIIA